MEIVKASNLFYKVKKNELKFFTPTKEKNVFKDFSGKTYYDGFGLVKPIWKKNLTLGGYFYSFTNENKLKDFYEYFIRSMRQSNFNETRVIKLGLYNENQIKYKLYNSIHLQIIEKKVNEKTENKDLEAVLLPY